VLDLRESSWAVRAYYSIDVRLPWFKEGIGNSGVYALSRAGRSRFDAFPNITTDDSFVRVHFQPHERVTVQGAVSIVTAPATLRSLIKIKTRSHFSKWELQSHCPQLLTNGSPRNAPVLRRLALNPLNWPALAVYTLVKLIARVRCRLIYQQGDASRWERDDSSRVVPVPASPVELTPVAQSSQAGEF
jgi:hypothetical protein